MTSVPPAGTLGPSNVSPPLMHDMNESATAGSGFLSGSGLGKHNHVPVMAASLKSGLLLNSSADPAFGANIVWSAIKSKLKAPIG
jgi:hypothetical protein